jgi:O-antigen ligase
MAAFVRGWRRAAVIGVLVLAPVLYVLLEGTGLIGKRLYLGVDDDVSAASHLATIQVGFELALDHWVTGIGHESFEESSTAYAGLVTGELARLGARSRLGEAKVHNDYLNVWFSWGIGALTAYLAVFAGTLFNCLVAARSRDWLIRGAAIGCIGGVVTYAVGSATHNYLDAGIVLWLFAGLSAALVPLAQIAPVQAPARRIALLRRSLRAPVRSLA